jgi:hypothetical protein
MRGGEHDAFFPNGSAARVFYEVYFVENYVFNVREPFGVVVYYISEYFRSHYQAWRVLVDDHIAGYYADFIAVGFFEIAVFLVG